MVLHREESAGEIGLRKAFEDAEVVQSSCRPTTTARKKSWENARKAGKRSKSCRFECAYLREMRQGL